jgi:hypothetical protein
LALIASPSFPASASGKGGSGGAGLTYELVEVAAPRFSDAASPVPTPSSLLSSCQSVAEFASAASKLTAEGLSNDVHLSFIALMRSRTMVQMFLLKMCAEMIIRNPVRRMFMCMRM